MAGHDPMLDLKVNGKLLKTWHLNEVDFRSLAHSMAPILEESTSGKNHIVIYRHCACGDNRDVYSGHLDMSDFQSADQMAKSIVSDVSSNMKRHREEQEAEMFASMPPELVSILKIFSR